MRTDRAGFDRRRATAVLGALLLTAVVVSVVHYADNYLNYESYPQSSTGLDPSPKLILVAWFVFTGLGLAGYLLFRRSAGTASIVLLALYSGSGLVGLGHYAAPGAADMPWWRQAHVIADIACGLAVLAFAVWALRRSISPRAA